MHLPITILVHLTNNIHSNITHVFDGEKPTLEFEKPCDKLDEDSRLYKTPSFDAFRPIQYSFHVSEHDKNAFFLGSLLAYDLVANFDPIGEVSSLNRCPDYVFYVAETLIIIVDHQR